MITMGIVGCGYWGPNLIRNYYQLPNCNMLICCDLDQKKLDRMKTLYPGILTTDDVRAVMNNREIDAVGIATPVFTHYPLAKQALLHGKHVFVEKPLCDSSDSCLELIRLAEEEGKILMVGHTFEYTAAVNKIKEIVKSGDLGEILYISSVRLNLGLFQPDINVIWDLAPHDISIITYILGEHPISVNGQGKGHYRKDIEDVATITLNFRDGAIAFVHTSWLDPNKVRRTTIVGSKKMLIYNDTEPQEKIKIFDKGVDAPPYYDTFGEFPFSYRYGDIYSPRIDDYEPLRRECAHFLECIEKNQTPRSDGYSGLRVVAVLEAASESLKNDGKAIPIKYAKFLRRAA
ncbi:MAG: Gfo/Idh/MocA family oxidoreductase [Candidatus Aenigmarchaeota archaeon]|nr:Gfo/Idh/MocA family oxidoreductase [Candidatus Aenigmarchaeota archaeon]